MSSSPSPVSLGHLINDFLFYVRYEQAKPVSVQTYETHKKRLTKLKELWGDREIETLQPSDVSLIRMQMAERGCKISYIGTFLGLVRSFLKYCGEERKLAVFSYTLIKVPKGVQGTAEYLNEEQLKRFLGAISLTTIYGIRFMAFVAASLGSGMRISEELSLNRNTIDWASGTGYILGKGGKKRLVKIPPWAIAWIRRYLDERTDDCEALFVTHNPQHETVRMVPEDIRRYFRVVAKKAGLGRVIPHMLRKTFATHFRKNGGDVHDIQKWLGHSKIATTERYLGTDWDSLKHSHDKFVSYGSLEKSPDKVVFTSWICNTCGKGDRPHAAKGECDRCYVSAWRKRKAWTRSTTFDRVNAYVTNTTNEAQSADL